jgi:Glycosyl hydrolase family 12
VGGNIRAGTIGVVLAAALAAGGGLTTVHLMDARHSVADNTVARPAPTATGKASAESFAASLTGTPRAAAGPHVAVMPGHKSRATGKPSPAKSPPASSGSATAPAASQPAGGQPPSQAAPASGSSACAHPQYVTSDPNGMWNQAPYFVANDAWNVSAYKVSQTLYACSSANWYVVATMDNSKGDGAVKTYPDSHRDFDSEPAISSFNSITSTFAETSPDTGIYEDAYDIWLNGVASSGSTEVMIWTDNHGQTPAGSVQGTVTVDGRSYTVYKTTGNYIAFVADSNFTSGTMDLLAFFKWLMTKGLISGSSTLGAVDYGVELVSTNGAPATFTFSNFAVNAS